MMTKELSHMTSFLANRMNGLSEYANSKVQTIMLICEIRNKGDQGKTYNLCSYQP